MIVDFGRVTLVFLIWALSACSQPDIYDTTGHGY